MSFDLFDDFWRHKKLSVLLGRIFKCLNGAQLAADLVFPEYVLRVAQVHQRFHLRSIQRLQFIDHIEDALQVASQFFPFRIA